MLYEVIGLNEVHNGLNFNIHVSHKSEVLSFTLASLGRSVVKSNTIFNELNALLNTFTDDELDSMFEILKDIKSDIESITSMEFLFRTTQEKTAAFLAYFNFSHVTKFVAQSKNIPIPANFLDVFNYDITKNITRDKTYIKTDYIELVSIIIILKSLLPIFSQYIYLIKNEVGNEYKESYVFGIIDKSQYYNHRTLTKLTDYITGSLDIRNFETKEIDIKGISKDEYIEILLARTIIRKLIVSDLYDADVNHNLITYTYKFMSQIKKENEKGSNDSITIKRPIKEGDKESTLSTLEQFKLKQDVSIGDIVSLEHYIMDDINLFTRLYPAFDVNLYNQFNIHSQQLLKEIIYSPQIIMLQILFKKVVSCRALPYLPKGKIVNFLAAGSTILWQENLKFLALLLGSITRTSEVQMISSTGTRGRLSSELIDELDQLFPYKYIKREGNIVKNKLVNPAIDDIDKLVSEFSDHIWYSTADTFKIREALQDNFYNDTRLIIPHLIRNEVAKFIILSQRL